MNIPSNFSLLYGAAEIERCVRRLGEEITAWADGVAAETGKDIVAIPVLRGSIIFCADLVRQIPRPIQLVPVRAWAYEMDRKVLPEGVRLHLEGVEVEGRSLLLIDDICDTGRTLAALSKAFVAYGAREVKSAVFVKREQGNEAAFEPDFIGMRYSGQEWLVGYGMDTQDRWRCLPSIYIIQGEG